MSIYSHVDFHVMPINAGQIVEVAYGLLPDGCGGGVLVRRSHDRSDHAVSYSHADLLIVDGDEEFTPWNGTLPSHGPFVDA